MPIKDILFPMISYPVPTRTNSVEKAVGLAASFGAHLCGLTFELDMRSPVGLYADPVNVSGIFAAERAKSTANARDLIAAFDDVAGRRGIMHEHAIEHCPPVEVPHLLVAYARLRDLTVFPVKAADHGQRSLVEQLIFESGRPVVLLPEDASRELSSPCARRSGFRMLRARERCPWDKGTCRAPFSSQMLVVTLSSFEECRSNRHSTHPDRLRHPDQFPRR
jgi:hypothetical protein